MFVVYLDTFRFRSFCCMESWLSPFDPNELWLPAREIGESGSEFRLVLPDSPCKSDAVSSSPSPSLGGRCFPNRIRLRTLFNVERFLSTFSGVEVISGTDNVRYTGCELSWNTNSALDFGTLITYHFNGGILFISVERVERNWIIVEVVSLFQGRYFGLKLLCFGNSHCHVFSWVSSKINHCSLPVIILNMWGKTRIVPSETFLLYAFIIKMFEMNK